MNKCLIFILLLHSGLFSQTTRSSATPTTVVTGGANDVDEATLLKVKRIYVDSFGEDSVSKELQAMVVSALVTAKRFKVTENRERADAVLRGTATEKTSHEVHAYGDSTAVGSAGGGYSTAGRHSNGGFAARHMGISDSSVNTETINDARVAMRLVNLDGDVIWTTTQESKGAKYKGATADAADKCVKKLLRDIEKLESANSPTSAETGSQAENK